MLLRTILAWGTSALFLSACSEASRLPVPCTATTDYTTCTETDGCTLVFTCAADGRLDYPAGRVVTFNIGSIYINQPALLQAVPGLAEPTWYSKTLNCTTNGASNEQIQGFAPSEPSVWTCPNYLPIASASTLIGKLDNQTIAVHSLISTAPVSKIGIATGTDCGDAVCGQVGTTVQRMFDCSQRITNFAGFGDSDGDLVSFEPGQPDKSWFLVSSSGTGQQQCAWLSPLITLSNPVTTVARNPATGAIDPTTPDLGIMGAHRILWSGVVNDNQTYNFWSANGTNIDLFSCIPGNECAGYQTSTPTTALATFVNVSGPIFSSGSVPALSPNACQAQLAANDPAFSGMLEVDAAPYTWQIPSYPFLMTLTSPYPNLCLEGERTENCNDQGFAAITASIPGFAIDTPLWSSSVSFLNGGGWFFQNGAVRSNGRSGAFPFSTPMYVRCASATW